MGENRVQCKKLEEKSNRGCGIGELGLSKKMLKN